MKNQEKQDPKLREYQKPSKKSHFGPVFLKIGLTLLGHYVSHQQLWSSNFIWKLTKS